MTMEGHGLALPLAFGLLSTLLLLCCQATLQPASPQNSPQSSNNFWHSVDSEYTAWLDYIQKQVYREPHFYHLMFRKRNLTTLTVDLNGNANFTSIQKAVDSIPMRNNGPYLILLSAGTYVEKVTISRYKRRITLKGQGRDNTFIVWNDTASIVNSTFQSATVAIDSSGFTAYDITFRNSAPAQQPGAQRQQAVALRISGDNAAFYRCGFEAHQDTLYDSKGRHYFESCYVQGSIDFIFGNGQSLYKNCEIHVVPITPGSLTAQKRAKATSNTGFSFLNCSISGDGVVYLGRAWGRFSRVVYLYTYFGDIIVPEGWYNWGIARRNETVFYGQYKCSGPGADHMKSVPWAHELSDEEAAPFLTSGGLGFIDGLIWLPQT